MKGESTQMNDKNSKETKEFAMPEMEVVVFDTEDVITTSPVTGGGFDGEWEEI